MDKVLGIVLILFGISIMIHPKYYNPTYSYTFDFSANKISFGIFLILVGVAWFWVSMRKNDNKKSGT